MADNRMNSAVRHAQADMAADPEMWRDKPKPAKETKPKIGAGAFGAWLRAGFKELAQGLQAFPDSNIRAVEEPGLYGSLTPGEVANAKKPTAQDANQEPRQSIFGQERDPKPNIAPGQEQQQVRGRSR